MKKIISLFQRNYDTDRLVRDEVVPGAEWVTDGEGIATVKWDGTACLIRGVMLYKRYRLKEGKPMPYGWLHHDFDPEAKSGHGWLPVDGSTADQWHREAWSSRVLYGPPREGTYELVGPSVQSNPYNLISHELWAHGAVELHDAPRDFDGLKAYLQELGDEGIVWHHPDGRMVKIKRRDFGFAWPG